MEIFSLPQVIGYAAYFMALYAGLQKDDNRLFLGFSVSSFGFSIHHFMLGNMTAAASCFIIGLRMYLNRTYKGAVIAYPFAVIALVIGYLTYQNPYSLLPTAAVLVATFGAAFCKGIALRFIFVTCCTFWLIHDIAMGSFGGTAQDITNIIIHLSTSYRLYRDAKKEPGKNPGSGEKELQQDRAA